MLDAQTDEVMSQWGRLDQVVADLREGRSGRLSIGYFASAGAAWMPSLVKRLTAEFPDLVLELVLNEVEQRRCRDSTSTWSSTRRTPRCRAATAASSSPRTSSSAIVPRGARPRGGGGGRAGRPARRDVGEQRLPAGLRPPPGRGSLRRRRVPPAVQRAGPGPPHRDRVRRAPGSASRCCRASPPEPAGDRRTARIAAAGSGAAPGRGRARHRGAEPRGRPGGRPARPTSSTTRAAPRRAVPADPRRPGPSGAGAGADGGPPSWSVRGSDPVLGLGSAPARGSSLGCRSGAAGAAARPTRGARPASPPRRRGRGAAGRASGGCTRRGRRAGA